MKEAQVSYHAGEGRSWYVEKGKVAEGDFFDEDWDVLMSRLHQLEKDITIGSFLEKYFNEPKFLELTRSVKGFVEGYDAADVDKASALALRDEWSSEDIKGYRPNGGYGQLMEFLREEILKHNGVLTLSTVVKKIIWKRNYVEVITDRNEKILGSKVLITVPVSVLKNEAIQFDPPLPQHQQAWQQIEVGGVIKFLFEFKDRIWEKHSSDFHQMPDLNFLFSDAYVPTWWTQKPSDLPLLTGWLSGPKIQTLSQDEKLLMAEAVKSLAYVLGCSHDHLTNEVRKAKIINWVADPFSQGAYAYKTLHTSSAIKTLTTPCDNTVYFAGEALYDGSAMGTVEAALASGRDAAEKLMI